MATIGLVDVPTHGALLTGVFRVHEDDRNTRQPRLVVDELPQLREAPIAVPCSLVGPSSPGPRANARQVFEGNRTVRALSFFNESLADLMIDVLLEAPLATGQLAQVALGRQACARLQVRTKLLLPLAIVFDHLSRHDVAVTGRGDVRHAEVHAQGGFHIAQFGIGDLARRQQEEHPVEKHEIGFPLPGDQQFKLARACPKRDRLATVQRPERDFPSFQLPRQDTVIVGDAAQRLEGALHCTVQAVGIRHLRQTADHHLRRQAEAFLRLIIRQVLHPVAVEGLRLEYAGADVVARGIRLLKRLLEGGMLVGRRVEAHLRNQFHVMKYCTEVRMLQLQRRRASSTAIEMAWLPRGSGL